MRSFLFGFRFVHVLVVAAGLVLLAFSGLKNALFYTKTRAEVLRIEDRCVPAGAPMHAATNCTETRSRAGAKRLRRYTAVHVRYTSPADGRVHDGVLIPLGRKAIQAAKLRSGDRWQIFAHDRNPEEIKAE
jgi:hypothetical protein